MTAGRFGLARFDVARGATCRYTMYEVVLGQGQEAKSPTLILAPATEANRPYFSELLKRSAKTARQLASARVNPALLAEGRESDRELFPLHVIRGWEDVVDADGTPVPFSRDACQEFVAELPDWIFDRMRSHALEPANFVGEGADPGDLAKNSGGA